MMLKPEKNNHRMKIDKFVAAEQEFNTSTYGIKAMIDVTLSIFTNDAFENRKLTALEIKTGKHK